MQIDRQETELGSGAVEEQETPLDHVDDIFADANAAAKELAGEPSDKPIEQESIEDSVREAMDQTKFKKENEPEQDPEPEQPLKAGKQPSNQKKVEPDFEPPARFTAEEREKFDKLPRNMKPLVRKAFEEMQSDYTKAKAVLNESLRQSGGVINVINRYIAKWGQNGVTPEQAISALASAQDNLTNPDREVRKKEYTKLFVNSGLTGQDFLDILEASGKPLPNNQSTQEESRLRPDEIEAINYAKYMRSQHEQQQQQQMMSEAQAAASEIDAVRQEKDHSGRYLYPKLFDPAFLTEHVKPLVSKLVATLPISYAEATKRAYAALEGQPTGNSTNGSTRLPSGNYNAQPARIVRTSPTVRGQGAPIQGLARPRASEVPDNVEDSVRQALEQIQRGGSY